MNNNNDVQAPSGAIARFLNTIERVGNKLPDPAIIFLVAMLLIWFLSWLFSGTTFDAIDPRTGEAIVVNNLLAGDSLAPSYLRWLKPSLALRRLVWCWLLC